MQTKSHLEQIYSQQYILNSFGPVFHLHSSMLNLSTYEVFIITEILPHIVPYSPAGRLFWWTSAY